MSLPETLGVWRLVSSLAAALLLGAAAPAQTPNTNSPVDQTQPIEVAFQPGEVVGHSQVIRERIQCGTNEFMFIVPGGMRAETRQGETVVLTSRDATYFITLRILSPQPTESDPHAGRREWITEHYPNAKEVEQFTTTVAGRPGEGVQLRQAPRVTGGRVIKIVWIPCNAGTLEFTLNADVETAKTGQQFFDILLLSFRSNEQGKILIVPNREES